MNEDKTKVYHPRNDRRRGEFLASNEKVGGELSNESAADAVNAKVWVDDNEK